MQIAVIGLGRMGANIVRRLMKNGHECVVFNRTPDKVKELEKEGAIGAKDIADLAKKLSKPRCAWIMVPAGQATQDMVDELAKHFEAGDIIIDGGNSMYKEDSVRAEQVGKKGIQYLDVGTSGGVWGLERGYCLMIGGPEVAVKYLDPVFATLAPGIGNIDRTPGAEKLGTAEKGYLHCGPSGAGHFVKMVHNGIEYGIMQAYAEGFDILKNAGNLDQKEHFDFQLESVAELWRRGSVVGSWLLDLSARALAENPSLSNFTGSVQDSGEGRWTVQAAIEEGVSANVLAASLFTRFRSRQDHSFGEKLLSAMRNQFGGHVEQPALKS